MVFVESLETPELSEDDRNHLERALRVRSGTTITVADGTGRWRPAALGPDLEPVGEIVTEARPQPSLTIGFAPVKGDRSDLIVQKLTELGVDAIVPLLTERSVVRWDDRRAEKNLVRQTKIAREAAMQSRNPWLPTLHRLRTLCDFLADRDEPAGQQTDGTPMRTVLADPGGEPLTGVVSRIAIGPEGGFSPEELVGTERVCLPGRILRTETAAIAAAVLAVNARRG